MKIKSTNIRISDKAYKFFVNLKKKTGIPIKVAIDMIIDGDLKVGK